MHGGLRITRVREGSVFAAGGWESDPLRRRGGYDLGPLSWHGGHGLLVASGHGGSSGETYPQED